MHLVLFSTSPHVFVSVSCLCCFISHVKQLQSTQSHFQKWPPLWAGVCEEHLTESFSGLRTFGISASSWWPSNVKAHLLDSHQHLSREALPPTSVPPSCSYSAYQTLWPHCVSAFWRDWWKGMWVKTPSGWGHATNRTERRCNKGRDLSLNLSSSLKGNSSLFWSHTSMRAINNTAHIESSRATI